MTLNTQNVARYLLGKGCVTKTAYFENSAIQLGSEFLFNNYRVIYRIEHSELIICYLGTISDKSTAGNFLALFNFLYHLGEDIADISTARMLVINNVANQPLQLIRNKLIRILIAKGAFSKSIDGNDWLLFDVSARE
ncbi:type III secretion system effector protein SseE [Yersinia pekkanenii]|uniref:Pathogenicity island 2 effector protein SseE n=1 Tax=Yersinia pekkanenii TaxID=1288385 RepID=A0A0T9QSW2_9GAMM|nr:pathogenicity island 2 effector protein SseE [Yersinia pekkanenii]CNI24858.1 pathogenicity island 2 effector protein SseE [Yersinia pekkanenii]CRY68900.1 pathogenicity island 2 effector protein SseE [Yersinia pekkanenii]